MKARECRITLLLSDNRRFPVGCGLKFYDFSDGRIAHVEGRPAPTVKCLTTPTSHGRLQLQVERSVYNLSQWLGRSRVLLSKFVVIECFCMMSSLLRIQKYTKDNSNQLPCWITKIVASVVILVNAKRHLRMLLVCVELGEIPLLCN